MTAVPVPAGGTGRLETVDRAAFRQGRRTSVTDRLATPCVVALVTGGTLIVVTEAALGGTSWSWEERSWVRAKAVPVTQELLLQSSAVRQHRKVLLMISFVSIIRSPSTLDTRFTLFLISNPPFLDGAPCDPDFDSVFTLVFPCCQLPATPRSGAEWW